MSEARHITLASTSNAQDAAWLAVADVAAVATDLGIDYRVIGGTASRCSSTSTTPPPRFPTARPPMPTWASALRSAQIHAWSRP
jgi:hypothetical protein